jgi:uncharacterized damage-inducible protein DinB
MIYSTQPEYWLRGPEDTIPVLLQPVAHTLLQMRAELNSIMNDFPETKLWQRPAGLAAPGFHLKHIRGVIDRLFTYARAEVLDDAQQEWLKKEGEAQTECLPQLLELLNRQVDIAIDQLKNTDPIGLTDIRYVGRKRIPSTLMGLLVHTAEHSMRHTGQLLVTVRVLGMG